MCFPLLLLYLFLFFPITLWWIKRNIKMNTNCCRSWVRDPNTCSAETEKHPTMDSTSAYTRMFCAYTDGCIGFKLVVNGRVHPSRPCGAIDARRRLVDWGEGWWWAWARVDCNKMLASAACVHRLYTIVCVLNELTVCHSNEWTNVRTTITVTRSCSMASSYPRLDSLSTLM